MFKKILHRGIRKSIIQNEYPAKHRGRRVLQIFQKIFRSPGDHRPKYFMAQ